MPVDLRKAFLRGAALGTVFLLVLSSPGLPTYQALAQTLTVPVPASSPTQVRPVRSVALEPFRALGQSSLLAPSALGSFLSAPAGLGLGVVQGLSRAAAPTAAWSLAAAQMAAAAQQEAYAVAASPAQAQAPRLADPASVGRRQAALGQALAAFQEAGREAPRPRTAMGGLVAAAVQIPRLLSLSSDSVLKFSSGKFFEQGIAGAEEVPLAPGSRLGVGLRPRLSRFSSWAGGRTSRAVPGVVRSLRRAYAGDIPGWVQQALPYAVALALPVLGSYIPAALPFALGSTLLLAAIQDNGQGPTWQQEQDFIAAAQRVHHPGQELSPEFISETAARLSVADPEMLGALLGRLVERGKLAALSNGGFLYLDLDEQSNDAAADRHAKEGLQLFRSANYARALHHLDAAFHRYEASQGASSAKVRELWALKNNAALELLRDASRRVQEMPGMTSEEQILLFQRAFEELGAEDFYFGWDHSPGPLDEEIVDALRLAASGLQPIELGNRVAFGETAHGISLAQEFAKGLGQTDPGPSSHQNPSDEAFLKAVAGYRPGERIGMDFLLEAGKTMGSQGPWPALRRLAEQKRVAGFSNGTYIYLVGLEDDPQEPKDPDVREARRLAKQGLELLAGEAIEDHVRALYFFYQAQGQLARYREFAGEPHMLQRQVEVLTDNAALQALYDIVNSYGEDQPPGSLLANMPDIPPDALVELHEHLQREYAAADHDPKPLTGGQRDQLVLALTRISANMQKKARIGPIPHEEEITDGFSLLFEELRGSPLRNEAHKGANLPSADQIGRFLAVLERDGFKPGSRLDADLARLVAGEAGASPEEAAALLGRAMERGHLMALHTAKQQGYIFVDLRTQEDSVPKYADAKVADSLAREGIGLLNKPEPSLADRARALSLFHEALQKYATYSRRHTVDHPHVQQVEVLENNATVGLLAAMLGEFDRQLPDNSGSARLDNFKRDLRTILPRLREVFYDISAKSHDFEPEVPELLEAYLKGGFSKSPGAMADDPQAQEGVRVLRQFFNSTSTSAPGQSHDSGRLLPVVQHLPSPPPSQWQAVPGKGNEALYNFGRNLTHMAADNKLDPLIGREDELEEVIRILSRRVKNNPILTGPEGSGKTAIVEGLAQRIVSGDVPPQLQGVNIFMLDITALEDNTKYRGSFEGKLKAILDSVRKSNGKIKLFVDEIQLLKGAGAAEGSMDMMQHLKTALARGEISMIGTTTPDFFLNVIEKDAAFKRRFDEVKVKPVTPEQAVDILKGLKSRYQSHHKVTISDEVIAETVRLVARYVWKEYLPDSALGIMDSAMAKVAIEAYRAERAGRPAVRVVTVDNIAAVIEKKTGIKVRMGEDAIKEMETLPDRLEGHVIGQHHVIAQVAVDLQAARSGLKDPDRPTPFIFAGPTGVGKTELARAIAAEFFDSPDQFVQIDMSEYQEAYSISGLIGASPGLLRSDEEGALTGPVWRVPYLVVLLDEIEEAHPNAWKLLLQILEDGWIHDKLGRKVIFKHVVLIMTTNIGFEKDQAQLMGFGQARQREVKEAEELTTEDLQRLHDFYSDELAGHFPAKLFGRISEHILAFRRLGPKDLERVLDLRLDDVNRHLGSAKKGMNATLTAAAREYILSYAVGERNWQVGARLIREVTWTRVSRALVEAELAGRITESDKVEVDYDAGLKKLVARKKALDIGPPIKTAMGSYLWLALLPLAVAASPAGDLGVLLALAGAGIVLLVWRHVKAYKQLAYKPQKPIRWRATVFLLAGLFFALDWGLKYLFVLLGFPVRPHDMEPRMPWMWALLPASAAFYLYYVGQVHSERESLFWLRKLRERHPILGYPLYWLLQVLTIPIGVHNLNTGDLARKYVEVAKALALYGITVAAMLGGIWGNGVQGLLEAQVADFIPIGHARANLADLFMFFGLPILWRFLDFFRGVRKAEKAGEPLTPQTWKYYLLPMLGLIGFVFSTWAGFALVPLAAWYVLVYSVLFLIGTFLADAVIRPFIRSFNRRFSMKAAPER